MMELKCVSSWVHIYIYIYIYMLNILSGKYNKNNDDRDDGLAVLKMKNGP